MLQRTRTDWVPARPTPHPTMEGYTIYSLAHPTSDDAPGITVVSKVPPEVSMQGDKTQACTLLMPGDRHRRSVAQVQLCGEHFTQGTLLNSFDGVVRHPRGTPGVEAERLWPTIPSFDDMKTAADRITPVPRTTLITYRPKQFDPAEIVSVRVGDNAVAARGPDVFVDEVFRAAATWRKLPRCVVYGTADDCMLRVIAVLKPFDGVPVEGIAEVVLEPKQLNKLLAPVRDCVEVARWAADDTVIRIAEAAQPPIGTLPDATYFPTLIETDESLRDARYWHELTAYGFRTAVPDDPTCTATPSA